MAKKEYPAMYTRDGIEIRVNQLLYEPDVNISDYSDDRSRVNLLVYRVIETNERGRSFRLRCHKGCERTILIEKTCSNKGLYANKAQAKAQALIEKNRGLKNIENKIAAYEKLRLAASKINLTMDPTPVEV